MQQLCLLAAIICFGMAAIKFCTARMKPNTAPARPKSSADLTAEEAKERMEENPNVILLDVRTQEEYETAHIPGAICIPNETIGTEDIPELPDKEQLILVYCRSGNRSKQASEKLAKQGYTNIVEFGGINSWTGETVSGSEA